MVLPRFSEVIALHWYKAYSEEKDKPMASDSTFRHSWAGKCTRQLQYLIDEVPPTKVPTISEHWRMHIGVLLHEYWQSIGESAFPGCEVESVVISIDGDGSGHIDLIIIFEDQRICIELKTVTGYPFKLAIGAGIAGKDVAEGPKLEHRLQLAVNTINSQCDWGVLIYISMETISKSWAEKKNLTEMQRFLGEWQYPASELEQLATYETDRWKAVKARREKGLEVPRTHPSMPIGARIVDVANSRWTKIDENGNFEAGGDVWSGQLCNYCSHQEKCMEDLAEGLGT